MNRAEKRRQQRSQGKLYTLNQQQMDQLKEQATISALDVIIGFSMLAIRDEFEFGHNRLMKFHKRFFDISEAYNEGYISTEDVWSTIEKETGIKGVFK